MKTRTLQNEIKKKDDDKFLVSLTNDHVKAKEKLEKEKLLDPKRRINTIIEHFKNLGWTSLSNVNNALGYNGNDKPEIQQYDNYDPKKKASLNYLLTQSGYFGSEEKKNYKPTTQLNRVFNYLTTKQRINEYNKKLKVNVKPDLAPVKIVNTEQYLKDPIGLTKQNTEITTSQPVYPIMDYKKVYQRDPYGEILPTPLRTPNKTIVEDYLADPTVFNPQIARLDDRPQYDDKGNRIYDPLSYIEEQAKLMEVDQEKYDYVRFDDKGRKLDKPIKIKVGKNYGKQVISTKDITEKGNIYKGEYMGTNKSPIYGPAQEMFRMLRDAYEIDGTKFKMKKDPKQIKKDLMQFYDKFLDSRKISPNARNTVLSQMINPDAPDNLFTNDFVGRFGKNIIPTNMTALIYNVINGISGNKWNEIDAEVLDVTNAYVDAYNQLSQLETMKRLSPSQEFDFNVKDKSGRTWLEKSMAYFAGGVIDYFDEIASRAIFGKMSENKRLLSGHKLTSYIPIENESAHKDFERVTPWELIKGGILETMAKGGVDVDDKEYRKILELEDRWMNRFPSLAHDIGMLMSDMRLGAFKAASHMSNSALRLFNVNQLDKVKDVTIKLIEDPLWMKKSEPFMKRTVDFVKYATNPSNYKKAIITGEGQRISSLYETLGHPFDHPFNLAVGGAVSYLASLDPSMSGEKLFEKAQSMLLLGGANVALGYTAANTLRMFAPTIKKIGAKMLDPTISSALSKSWSNLGFFAGAVAAQPVGVGLDQLISHQNLDMTWNGLAQEVLFGLIISAHEPWMNYKFGKQIKDEVSYRKDNPLIPTVKKKIDMETGEVTEHLHMREPSAFEYLQNQVSKITAIKGDITVADGVDLVGINDETIGSYLRKSNKKDSREARDNIKSQLKYLKETKGNLPIKGEKLGYNSNNDKIYAQFRDDQVLLTNESMGNDKDRQLNNMENMLAFLTHEGGHSMTVNEFDTNKDFKDLMINSWMGIKERLNNDNKLSDDIMSDDDLSYAFNQAGLMGGSEKPSDTEIKEFMALLHDSRQTKFRNKLQTIVLNGEKKSFSENLLDKMKSVVGIKDPNNVYNQTMKDMWDQLLKPAEKEINEKPNPFAFNMTTDHLRLKKDFFGDWENDPDNATYLTEKNLGISDLNKPVVLYRGSQTPSEGTKDNPLSVYRGNRAAGKDLAGIYYTLNPKAANMYSSYNRSKEHNEKSPVIHVSYGNMRNPLIVSKELRTAPFDFFEEPSIVSDKYGKPVPDYQLREDNIDQEDTWTLLLKKHEKNLNANGFAISSSSSPEYPSYFTQKHMDYYKQLGYDGVVYNKGEEIIFFDPSQIVTYSGEPLNTTINTLKASRLRLRTNEFKNFFGDWENDPENASKGTGAFFNNILKEPSSLGIKDIFKKDFWVNSYYPNKNDERNIRLFRELENNEPLTFYHATASEDFTEFSNVRKRPTGDWQGIYFSLSPSYNEFYAKVNRNQAKGNYDTNTEIYAPRQIPVYLDMRKPLIIEDTNGKNKYGQYYNRVAATKHTSPLGVTKALYETARMTFDLLGSEKLSKIAATTLVTALSPLIPVVYGVEEAKVIMKKVINKLTDQELDYLKKLGNNPEKYADVSFIPKSVVDKLKSMGYDSMIYNGGVEVVVFDPTQVKSAIGNRGTFDPNDANILNTTINTLKASKTLSGLQWQEDNASDVINSVSDYKQELMAKGYKISANRSDSQIIADMMHKYRKENERMTPEDIARYIRLETEQFKQKKALPQAEIERRWSAMLDALKIEDLDSPEQLHGDDKYDNESIERKISDIAGSLGYGSMDAYKRQTVDMKLKERTEDIYNKLIKKNSELDEKAQIDKDELMARAARIANVIDNSSKFKGLHLDLQYKDDPELSGIREHYGSYAADGTRINNYRGEITSYKEFGKMMTDELAKEEVSEEMKSLLNELFSGDFRMIVSVDNVDKGARHNLEPDDLIGDNVPDKAIKQGYFILPKVKGGLVLHSKALADIAGNPELAKKVAQEIQWYSFWRTMGSDYIWKHDGKAKQRYELRKYLDPEKMYEMFVEGKQLPMAELLKKIESKDYKKEVDFITKNARMIAEVGNEMKKYFTYIDNEKGIQTELPLYLDNTENSSNKLKTAIKDILTWSLNTSGKTRIQEIKENEYITGKIDDKYGSLPFGHAPLRLKTIEHLSYFEPDIYDDNGEINQEYLRNRNQRLTTKDGENIIEESVYIPDHKLLEEDPYLFKRLFNKDISDGLARAVNKPAFVSKQKVVGAKPTESVVKYNRTYYEGKNGIMQKSMEYADFTEPSKVDPVDQRYYDFLDNAGKQVSIIAMESAFKNHDAYEVIETPIPEYGITLVHDQILTPIKAFKTNDPSKKADPELLDFLVQKEKELVQGNVIPSWRIKWMPFTGKQGSQFLSHAHGIYSAKNGSGSNAMDTQPSMWKLGRFWDSENGEEAYQAMKDMFNNRIDDGMESITGLYAIYSIFNPAAKKTEQMRKYAADGLKYLVDDIIRTSKQNESSLSNFIHLNVTDAIRVLEDAIDGNMIKTDNVTMGKLALFFDNYIVGDEFNQVGTGSQLAYLIGKEFDNMQKGKGTGGFLTYVPQSAVLTHTNNLMQYEIDEFQKRYRGDDIYEATERFQRDIERKKAEILQQVDAETGLAKDGSQLLIISKSDYIKLKQSTIKNKVPILTLGSKVFAQRTPASSPDMIAPFIIAGITDDEGTISINAFTGAQVFGMDFDKDGLAIRIPDNNFTPDKFDILWNYINNNGNREGAWKNAIKNLTDMQSKFTGTGNAFVQAFGVEPQKRYIQPQHKGYYRTVVEAQESQGKTIGIKNNISQALENMHDDFTTDKFGNLVTDIDIDIKNKQKTVRLRIKDKFLQGSNITYNVQSNMFDLPVELSVDTWNQRAFDPPKAIIDHMIETVDGVPYREIANKDEIRKQVNYFFSDKAGLSFKKTVSRTQELKHSGITYLQQVPKDNEKGTWKNILRKYREIERFETHEESEQKENAVSYSEQKYITRNDLVSNRDKIYLFGDNLEKTGLGGQAKEMRGEINAIGIPTKKRPSMSDDSFMNDDEYESNVKAISDAFEKIPQEVSIIVPKDGIGTGLAKLKEKAPRTYEYLQNRLLRLKENLIGSNDIQKSDTPGYQGGFDPRGKGTPEGDGKDKAMRKIATSSIVELANNNPSSSRTTKETLGEYRDGAGIVMLARNKEFYGKSLQDITKKTIYEASSNGAKFVVGDMPNVDSQFIDYLNEIGADYEIYHTGNTSRIGQNKSFDIRKKDLVSFAKIKLSEKEYQKFRELPVEFTRKLVKIADAEDTGAIGIEDGKIIVNVEGMYFNYENRAWTKNIMFKDDSIGSTLPEDAFKNYNEYITYEMIRISKRNRHKKNNNESIAEYENRISELSYQDLKTNYKEYPEKPEKPVHIIPQKDDFEPLFVKKNLMKKLHNSIVTRVSEDTRSEPWKYIKEFDTDGNIAKEMDYLTRKLVVARANQYKMIEGLLSPYITNRGEVERVFSTFDTKPFGKKYIETYAGTIYRDVMTRYRTRTDNFDFLTKDGFIRYKNGYLIGVRDKEVIGKIMAKDLFDDNGKLTVDWVPVEFLNAKSNIIHKFADIDKPYSQVAMQEMIAKGISNVVKEMTDDPVKQGELWSYFAFSDTKMNNIYGDFGWAGGTLLSPKRFTDPNYTKLIMNKYYMSEYEAMKYSDGEIRNNPIESIKFARKYDIEPMVNGEKLFDFINNEINRGDNVTTENTEVNGYNMSISKLNKATTLKDITDASRMLRGLSKDKNVLPKEVIENIRKIWNKPITQLTKKDYESVYEKMIIPLVKENIERIAGKKGKMNRETFDEVEKSLLEYLSPGVMKSLERLFGSENKSNTFGGKAIRLTVLSEIANVFKELESTRKYSNSQLKSMLTNYTLVKSTIDDEIYRRLSDKKLVYKPEEVITVSASWKNGERITDLSLESMHPKDLIDQATMIQKLLPLLPKHMVNLFIPNQYYNYQKDMIFTILKSMKESGALDDTSIYKYKGKNKEKSNKIKSIVYDESDGYKEDQREAMQIAGLDDDVISDYEVSSEFRGMSMQGMNLLVKTINKGGKEIMSSYDLTNKGDIMDFFSAKDATMDNNQKEALYKYLFMKANANMIVNILRNQALMINENNKKINYNDPAKLEYQKKQADDLSKYANELTDMKPSEVINHMRKMVIKDADAIGLLEQILDSEMNGSPEELNRRYYTTKAYMNTKYKEYYDYKFTADGYGNKEFETTKLFDTVMQEMKTSMTKTGDYEANMPAIMDFIKKNLHLSIEEEINNVPIYEEKAKDKKEYWVNRFERAKELKDKYNSEFVGKLAHEMYSDALAVTKMSVGEGASYYNVLREMGIPGFEKPFESLYGAEKKDYNSKAKSYIRSIIHNLTDKANQDSKVEHIMAVSSMDTINGIDERLSKESLNIEDLLLYFRPDLAYNSDYFSYNVSNFADKVHSKIKQSLVNMEHLYQQKYNEDPDTNAHAKFVAMGKLSKVMKENSLYTDKIDKDAIFEKLGSPGDNYAVMVHDRNHEPKIIQGRFVGTMKLRQEREFRDSIYRDTLVLHDDNENGKTVYMIDRDNIVNIISGAPYRSIQGKLNEQIKKSYAKVADDVIKQMEMNFKLGEDANFDNIRIHNTDIDLEVYKSNIKKNPVMSEYANSREYRTSIGKINAKTAGSMFIKSIDKFLAFNRKAVPLAVYLGGQYYAVAAAAALSTPVIGWGAATGIMGAAGVKLANRYLRIWLQNHLGNIGYGGVMPTTLAKDLMGWGWFGRFLVRTGGNFAQNIIDINRLYSRHKGKKEGIGSITTMAMTEGTQARGLTEDISTEFKGEGIYEDSKFNNMAKFKRIHRIKKGYKELIALRDNQRQMDKYYKPIIDKAVEMKITVNELLKRPDDLPEGKKKIRIIPVKNESKYGQETESSGYLVTHNGLSLREHKKLLLGYSDLLSYFMSGAGFAQDMEVKSSDKSYMLSAYRIEDVMKARKEAVDAAFYALGIDNTVNQDLSPWLRAEIEKSMVWKSIGNYSRTPSQSTSTGRLLTMFGNFSKENGLNQIEYAYKRNKMHNALVDELRGDELYMKYMKALGIPIGEWYLHNDSLFGAMVTPVLKNTFVYGGSSLLGYITMGYLQSVLSWIGQIGGTLDEYGLTEVINLSDSMRLKGIELVQTILELLMSNATNRFNVPKLQTGVQHQSSLKHISRFTGNLVGDKGGGYMTRSLLEPFGTMPLLATKYYYDNMFMGRSETLYDEEKLREQIVIHTNNLLLPITGAFGSTAKTYWELYSKEVAKEEN